MNLLKVITDWRNPDKARAESLSLVRSFYAADPMSSERREILHHLIDVEHGRPASSAPIDLNKIPERKARIMQSFAQSALGHPDRVNHGHDLDVECREMIGLITVRRDLKGAARDVVLDRIDCTNLESVGHKSFIPRGWSRGPSRHEDRMDRLMNEALAFHKR